MMVVMRLNFLSKSRGITNLCSRIGTILSRFGISSSKFAKLLYIYNDITKSLGCVPTFPITAVILKRHPDLIKKLSENGIDFAIHGYIHTDYRALPLQEQIMHYEKAINVFKMCKVPYTGFRAPFLRTNSDTSEALYQVGFAYDSSQAVYWNVIDRAAYSNAAWQEHDRLLEFYQSQSAPDVMVLPRMNKHILEIPVSIPDDEVMAERLGITDSKQITAIWGAVLQRAYEHGELFTLQLHPERIRYCGEALRNTVKLAQSLNPPVWITTLGQIAGWWKEKEEFKFEIVPRGNSGYGIHARCSGRATVLFKNCKANAESDNWYDGYRTIASRDFVLESPARPVIGLAEDSSPEAVAFLRSEGYVTEVSIEPKNFGLYLNGLAQFGIADEKTLSEKIEKSGAPLLRYWRWPDRSRMALTITGDIDSITLIDFGLRVCENWWQRRRRFEH
jgi:peptidoglycan/xylan/chitin deacetylase (PgdA/CDA1 family)